MVCTGLLPSNNTPEVSRVREESCVCPLGGGGGGLSKLHISSGHQHGLGGMA